MANPKQQKGYFVFRKKNLEAKADFLKKGENRGYIIVPSAVLTDPTLTIYAKLVFSYLLGCARKEGRGKVNPSDLAIAAYCGISKRQAIRARELLRERMWLDWERTGSSNEYRIYSILEHDDLARHSARTREEVSAAREQKAAVVDPRPATPPPQP